MTPAANTNELQTLLEAERMLRRALAQIGSRRTPLGYPGIRVYDALEETRAAIRLMQGDRPGRRSYERLARTRS